MQRAACGVLRVVGELAAAAAPALRWVCRPRLGRGRGRGWARPTTLHCLGSVLYLPPSSICYFRHVAHMRHQHLPACVPICELWPAKAIFNIFLLLRSRSGYACGTFPSEHGCKRRPSNGHVRFALLLELCYYGRKLLNLCCELDNQRFELGVRFLRAPSG